MTNNDMSTYTIIPDAVFAYYNKLDTKPNVTPGNITEEQMWVELCFCILSANVSYDLVRSCNSIIHNSSNKPKWKDGTPNPLQSLSTLLNLPIFEPKKKDGTLRKYRYPNIRAKQIINARNFIYHDRVSIKSILEESKTDIEARDYLAANIPGLGLKEASHFIRNICNSDSVAVLDVHMLEYLRQRDMIKLVRGRAIQKNTYLIIEKVLTDFVQSHKLKLSIFDLAVWHYMRNQTTGNI